MSKIPIRGYMKSGVLHCGPCAAPAIQDSNGDWVCPNGPETWLVDHDSSHYLDDSTTLRASGKDSTVSKIETRTFEVARRARDFAKHPPGQAKVLREAAEAINSGWTWSDTEEGHEFWSWVHERLEAAARELENPKVKVDSKVRYKGQELNETPGAGTVHVRPGATFIVRDLTEGAGFVEYALCVDGATHTRVWLPVKDLEVER